MTRRLLPTLMAALMLLMLLGAAGHALQHMHQHEACTDCPVCHRLASLGEMLARMVLLMMLLSLPQATRRTTLSVQRHPFIRAVTPVSLKVKLTS